ncbi:unnamed protein product [Spirodela intermedia]|uniref:Uncharacterized protein n=1 Tax=Spirodela intermedia TaxID=51605 RepID=A0A7I8J164_SPIIN|nr:unnamed protein product [Spirodela intermedia]CAA6663060.1 unnamed protein product [Spirodela intermedia]
MRRSNQTRKKARDGFWEWGRGSLSHTLSTQIWKKN